ncbi:MAG: sn-glycerol-3-phosphate transporter [Pseudomonas sp.]|uniref:sn-glycerol-3-phosphate transporter n=1 Tax=Pseudomonas abieticivorans TaxID=2931382 RepID=UPI0020BD602B|nr:sn-glycerol-3-phosphate transporter [Pseudomonas sp. PIA16]MDE1164831.1 sn-glycerol-3-phosphate transporter [Pseudomonas sp.]
MKFGFWLFLSLFCVMSASADEGDFWYVQTSAYTTHWRHDPDHNNHQELIGLERNFSDGTLIGGATFRNSYYQRSYYGYVGKRWESADYPVYVKLSGGLIQGYKGEYRDKIPLNHLGVAPVIIPAVGAHLGPVGAEFVLLGNAAAMVNAGLRF